MTYNEFIQDILDTRGRFGIPKGEYKERHHIIPQCMAGTDDEDNLIDLYAREHFIAHKLLAEEYSYNSALVYAFHMMAFCTNKSIPERDFEILSEEYELARKLQSQLQKGVSKPNPKLKGRTPWNKGLTKDTDNRIVASHKGKNPHEWGAGMKSGYKLSDDYRLKRSIAYTGEGNPRYGKEVSEETKQKISLANNGKKDSLEVRTKKSNATKGANNPKAIKVICVETNEIFGCIKDAYTKYSIKKGVIQTCCKDPNKTAGGYHWKYLDE